MLEMKRYSKYNPQNYAFMTKLAPDISLSMNTNGLNSLLKEKAFQCSLQGRELWQYPTESHVNLLFSPEMPPLGIHSSGLTRWSIDLACIVGRFALVLCRRTSQGQKAQI